MSDQVLQQAAGQAAPTPSTGAVSGQPENAPQGGQPAEPQYLTKDEALRMIQEATKQAQSLVDKSSARIESKIAEVRAQVGSLTPEQETSLRNKLANEANAPTQSPAPNAQAQPGQAAPASEATSPALEAAFALMEQKGVVILDSDPELKLIDTANPTTEQVEKAIAAKIARLSNTADPTRAPLGGGNLPAGNVPRGPREMLQMGLSQK